MTDRIIEILATTAADWSNKMTDPQNPLEQEPVIWRADLQRKMRVSSNTVRRWMIDGKLPPPDVDLSRRTRGWRLSTLREAGINLA